jgi:hypothetical protein
MRFRSYGDFYLLQVKPKNVLSYWPLLLSQLLYKMNFGMNFTGSCANAHI